MNNHKNNSFEDHESDPAHTPGHGWVDEGGASHLGPATHLTVEDTGAGAPVHRAEEQQAGENAESQVDEG